MEFVDLGLSVKWANLNVGAKNEFDYCKYFSWTEVLRNDVDWSELNENVDLGVGCRMPSEAEINELIKNCIWEWTSESGVSGYNVKSEITGNQIFLPACGLLVKNKVYYEGEMGDYLTGEIDKKNAQGVIELIIRKGYKDKYIAGPHCKRSVRLVKE